MEKTGSNGQPARTQIDEDIIEAAKELRHELHRHAELSCRETETKRILIRFLTEHTKLEIVDRGRWFYAVYRSPNAEKRRIAFRADMDALPIDEGCSLPYSSAVRGVSHKCGHDGHSAGLAAFAVETDRSGSANDVYFLFQFGEETGVGAAECCALIDEEHIDEIYGYHNIPGFPLGSVAVHSGVAACASTGLVLAFTGKNSHASQPENGVNPAFALAKLIAEVPLLVRIAAADTERPDRRAEDIAPGAAMSTDGIVMCTVVGAHVGSREDGGEDAFGTSAGHAKLMLTVRAESEARLERLNGLLIARARELSEKAGLAFRFEYRELFPETRNDAACAEKVRAAAAALGVPIAEWNEPFRSSEDFGMYLKKTRGALFYIGAGEDHAPLHTAAYDFPDALIGVAAGMFGKLSE